MNLLQLLLPLGVLTPIISGANILFFFGMSTYSHRVPVWPLVEKLADKGHNITFLQPFANKSPHPKVTEIVSPKEFATALDDFNFIELRLQGGN